MVDIVGLVAAGNGRSSRCKGTSQLAQGSDRIVGGFGATIHPGFPQVSHPFPNPAQSVIPYMLWCPEGTERESVACLPRRFSAGRLQRDSDVRPPSGEPRPGVGMQNQ